MAYLQRAIAAVGTEKSVAFHRFTLDEKKGSVAEKGTLNFTQGRNCDLSDGRIRAGIGAEEVILYGEKPPEMGVMLPHPRRFYTLPYREENQWKYVVLCIAHQGSMFIYNESLNSLFGITVESFGALPKVLTAISESGENIGVLCCKSGVKTYTKSAGSATIYSQAASDIACVFHERLIFAVLPDTLVFSAPLKINSFSDTVDESGHILFPSEDGNIVGLEGMGEELYLVRERGLARLDMRGAARDFKAEKIPFQGGKIFRGTIAVCGNRIIFLASDGLYSFDGNSAKKICEQFSFAPVEPADDYDACQAFCFEGKYILRYFEAGGSKMLVYDLLYNNAYFSSQFGEGLSPTCLGAFYAVQKKLYRLSLTGSLPEGYVRYVVAENTDFGVSGRKLWKKVVFQGEGNAEAEFENEFEKKRFTVTFTDGKAICMPLLKGEKFTLRIYLKDNAVIRGAEISFNAQRRKVAPFEVCGGVSKIIDQTVEAAQ